MADRYDLEFFFDPICPFAWVTSRWVTEVADQQDYRVRWRFICLSIINEGKDYGKDFPPAYPKLHGFGRTPDQLGGFLLPLFGAFVAASFHRKGWWWLGPVMAMPAFAGMHLLFAAGIEMAFSRPPSLTEEGRFLLAEGHRLVAGLVGAYAGALLQSE